MPTSDTTEAGLETLIVRSLVGVSTDATTAGGTGREHQPIYAGGGYVEGDPRDYDRDHGVDLAKLLDLVRATQPEVVEQFDLENDGPERLKFLNRLQGEVAIRGVVDVLRKGVSHGPLHVDLFYGAPTPGNVAAADRYAANIFSVTRQLRDSKGGTRLALDLALFAVATRSYGSARTSRAGPRGSSPSTRATTTEPATRRTRAGSRRTISGRSS